MTNTETMKSELKNIIDTLEDALKVAYGVDYTKDAPTENRASYCLGYSKSAMLSVVESLKKIV